MNVTVYSLPDCLKCEILKEWLKNNEIKFENKLFDTEAQTEFVMRNMFGDPPVLTCGNRMEPSDTLFSGEVLKEDYVREVLKNG
jgi:glutaredoxin